MNTSPETLPVGQMELLLLGAWDDLPQFSKEYQASLTTVFETLRAEGVEAEPQRFSHDGMGGEGGLSGEIKLLTYAVDPAIIEVLDNWLAAKSGRSLRFKIGDIEVHAHSREEIDSFVATSAIQRSLDPPRVESF